MNEAEQAQWTGFLDSVRRAFSGLDETVPMVLISLPAVIAEDGRITPVPNGQCRMLWANHIPLEHRGAYLVMLGEQYRRGEVDS